MTVDAFKPLSFVRGPSMSNRFMLAPLTNLQSHDDGCLSDEELNWLVYRARGGFAETMTCAASINRAGVGFRGQLGCYDDKHLDGLTRLASALREQGSLSSIQLHHAGIRSIHKVTGLPLLAPSDDKETGAREMTRDEIAETIEDFIAAAVRADTAGFDGVEIHGAHGYLVGEFISPKYNRRDDEYGGSLKNRTRFLQEIIEGVRQRCRPDFQLGVRLSPERFGMRLNEVQQVAQWLFDAGEIDYLDISLWDAFKEPVEEEYQGRSLMSYFTELNRGEVRLGVAGKIYTPKDVRHCLEQGADFVLLGRAAILQHDFPLLMQQNPDFVPTSNPVSRAYLRDQGLSENFIDYMSSWDGFVESDKAS